MIEKSFKALLIISWCYVCPVIANDFFSEEFRFDAGGLFDLSKTLPEGGASDSGDMWELYIYGRKHGIRPAKYTGNFSGLFELEYAKRSKEAGVDGDEIFGSGSIYWVDSGDIFDPDFLSKLSVGMVGNFSSHDEYDENSSLSVRGVGRNVISKTSDYIWDANYTFSDWENNNEAGDSINAEIQLRYANPFNKKSNGLCISEQGLAEICNYFIFRLAGNYFMYNDESFEDKTTISLQPFIWRKTISSNFYIDTVLGRQWDLNVNGGADDSRSYFLMFGLSYVFNSRNFVKGEPVGGGGGSGGRYYRP